MFAKDRKERFKLTLFNKRCIWESFLELNLEILNYTRRIKDKARPRLTENKPSVRGNNLTGRGNFGTVELFKRADILK